MTFNNWSELFNKAAFSALKKSEGMTPGLISLRDKLTIDPSTENFHPNRQNEFILGRLCATMAFERCTGKALLSLPAGEDRSPSWPVEVVGTISHSRDWVGAAVARSTDLIGIGMDFEIMGRTRLELQNHIRSPKDINTHSGFSEEELLTLIFSMKESLYKCLHPIVKKFFGFEDAAILEINQDQGIFVIDLLKELSKDFGPTARHRFSGRFGIYQNTCLTVLELVKE